MTGRAPTVAPLSFQQEELADGMRRFPEVSAKYDNIYLFQLDGDIDIGALASAIGDLVARHPALRTTIESRAGGDVQLVWPSGEVDITETTAGSMAELADDLVARRHVTEDVFAGGRLFRPGIHSVEGTVALSFTFHHLLSDGWSDPLLWRDFAACYAARTAGRAAVFPPLEKTYAEYAAEQRAGWADMCPVAVPFWRETIGDCTGEIDWPWPPRVSDHHPTVSDWVRFGVGEAGMEAVRNVSRTARATQFMVLLAATAMAVAAVTGQADLLLGTDVAGREEPWKRGVIGNFTDTRMTALHLTPGRSLPEVAGDVRAAWVAADRYRDAFYDQVLRAVGERKVFKVNGPVWGEEIHLDLPGIKATPIPAEPGTGSPRDLGVIWQHTGEGFAARIRYRPARVDRAAAEAVRDEILALLQPGTAR